LEAGTIIAIAVDTLASAVVASDLARNDPNRKNISPDGAISVDATFGFLFSKAAVRCALFDRNVHSRMPLVPTPARYKQAGV
jgi:hypothetical protein